MTRIFIYFFLLFLILSGCFQGSENLNKNIHLPQSTNVDIRGSGLLLSDFHTLEELEEEISIQYSGWLRKKVQLEHYANGVKVCSILKSGVSEKDLEKARDGGIAMKIIVSLRSPYAAFHRKDLQRIVILARRRRVLFGEGDVAFYDLSKVIKEHISPYDSLSMSPQQLSEKGYFNTFNHITAQAMMTSIFSERFADFIADIHELGNMPELPEGNFTPEELADFENGPVDNYLDMINNEWGQELGKSLKEKYQIQKNTKWSPALLSNYLNDIQAYYSRAFRIGFKAFKPSDDIVIRFSNKINQVMAGEVFEK